MVRGTSRAADSVVVDDDCERFQQMRQLGIGTWVLGFACVLLVGCDSRDAATDADLIKVIIRLSPATFDPRIGTDEDARSASISLSTATS